MNVGIEITVSIFIFLTWLYGANCNLYLQPGNEINGYFTGDNFFITCHTTEGNVDQLSWINPDQEAITDKFGRIRIQPTGVDQKGLELVVETVEFDDAGKYTCQGVDSSVTFELVVYRAISFGDTPKHQHAREGENALITCHVKASPDPVVSWSSIGRSVKNSEKYKTLSNGLEIINASRKDAGKYSCTALLTATYASRIESFEIEFDVWYIPEFVKDTEKMVYTQMGVLTNLVCTVSASPAPKFRWVREGRTIHNSSDFLIFYNETTTTLQLTVHEESQLGEYNCIVSNEMGQAEQTITLEVGETPDAPIFKVASEDQGTLTVELDADDKADMQVIGFKVEFVSADASWDQAISQEFNKGDKYILNNVNYDTEYKLRASAKNFAGYGDYSEVVQYKTRPSHEAEPVITDNANSVMSSFVLMVMCSCIMGYLIA